MDYQFEKAWQDTVARVSEQFGEKLDYAAMLFLIGVQELGDWQRTYKKDEKLALMHIAVCTLLEPFGYYRYTGHDDDGWPHYERIEDLPPLSPADQELLIRKAIIRYFRNEGVGE